MYNHSHTHTHTRANTCSFLLGGKNNKSTDKHFFCFYFCSFIKNVHIFKDTHIKCWMSLLFYWLFLFYCVSLLVCVSWACVCLCACHSYPYTPHTHDNAFTIAVLLCIFFFFKHFLVFSSSIAGLIRTHSTLSAPRSCLFISNNSI